jgi:uncharacterized membrane protein YccC
MVIFFIALLLFCFTISNTATRAFVVAMSVITAVLVLWCIWLAWETTEDYDLWQNSKDALRRTRNDIVKRGKEFGQDLLSPFSTRRAPEVAHSIHSMAERQGNFGGV